MRRAFEKLVNNEDVFCKPTESWLYYFPFWTNYYTPLIVNETKQYYCTYSKHTLANKNLWFKNLLIALKLPKNIWTC